MTPRKPSSTAPEVVPDAVVPDEREFFSDANRFALTGVLAHATIASVAAAGPETSNRLIVEQTRAQMGAWPAPVPYRRAVANSVSSLATLYFSRFRFPEMEFLDAELEVGPESRLDLVWGLPEGRVLIDEVKTGAPPKLGWTATEQMVRYLEVGRYRYGARFHGLRVCWLCAPGLSATFDVAGKTLSLGPDYAVSTKGSNPLGKRSVR